MKIIAGLKMPYEKLDQVVQNLVAGANWGTSEKLFFLESSQENIHLKELQRKVLTYKSRPPAAERPLCQLHCAKAGSCKCQPDEKWKAENSREAWNYLLILVTLPALAKMARQG